MSEPNAAMQIYLTGLRNQHAVETQAIGTIQNQLPRMKSYPKLHAKMQADKERSTDQAARLDRLLESHGTSKSLAKEAVTGTVATVAGFAHSLSSDEVLKDVLAAIGFKAYEIGSYKVLITLAKAVDATIDLDSTTIHAGGAGDGRLAWQPPPRLRACLRKPASRLVEVLFCSHGPTACLIRL